MWLSNDSYICIEQYLYVLLLVMLNNMSGVFFLGGGRGRGQYLAILIPTNSLKDVALWVWGEAALSSDFFSGYLLVNFLNQPSARWF